MKRPKPCDFGARVHQIVKTVNQFADDGFAANLFIKTLVHFEDILKAQQNQGCPNIFCAYCVFCGESQLHQHCFDFEKLFQPVLAEFATIAGLFVPAKRNQRIEFAAVDFDLSRSQAPGDSFGAFRVA